MRYSIEPRDGMYVKRYGSLSFATNIGKNLCNKYGQKRFYTAQKTAEATGDLTGNKIADKIVSKKSSKELHNSDETEEITTHKKRCISPEEKTTNY